MIYSNPVSYSNPVGQRGLELKIEDSAVHFFHSLCLMKQ